MMRRVAGLKDLTDEYDSLLCDVWGVLHNGVRAFPKAVDALCRFRETAGPVVLITNAPRPHPPIQEQLLRLGVPDEAYDAIVTSGDVTRSVITPHPQTRLFHLGPDRDLSLYDDLDVILVPEAEAELVSCTGLLDDTTETPDDYRPLFERFVGRGLKLVCANPDLVVERGDQLVYCAGALARLYVELGGEAVHAGKPHAPIYAAARQKLTSFGSSRILAVGDGLPTDIRGAVENDIAALFVTGGIHAADFGDHANPDAERVAARLKAEGLSVAAYIPKLVWSEDGAS